MKVVEAARAVAHWLKTPKQSKICSNPYIYMTEGLWRKIVKYKTKKNSFEKGPEQTFLTVKKWDKSVWNIFHYFMLKLNFFLCITIRHT